MEKILVLDFGGQYDLLIARRVRELGVFAEITPYNKIDIEEIKARKYKGIIFTGGPNSVYDEKSPHYDPEILNIGIPILGICYGHQLLAYMAGGEIKSAGNISEYGKTEVSIKPVSLFDSIPEKSICWMSHTDYVSKIPVGFENIASTVNCPCAAMADRRRNIYGVQFHPEVTHTEYGKTVLHNFLFGICGCSGDWKMDDFIEKTVADCKAKLKGKKVLCALSGGVDSSVAAVLMHRAVGDNLVCVFVDHGLLRKNEGDDVEHIFREKFNIKLVDNTAFYEFI